MPQDKQLFDTELQNLRDRLLEMGVATEEMLRDSLRALTRQDLALARAVAERDDLIDVFDVEIETQCLRLMAGRLTQASDRRLIHAALKIVTDIERIADHTVDIARVVERMSGEVIYKPLVDVAQLGEIAASMLRRVLDAFVRHDLVAVREVIADDDRADALYSRMRRELAEVLQRDANSVLQANYLLFVAHYLERICDHCTNIAERIAFLETGDRPA
jgi:phosphate transport system protein